jgi:hypothetical protein
MNLDQEIDKLYQLPAKEFTPARNALAKAVGSNSADVKALQKPSAPAWAVNQLYWQSRDIYDSLIDAAERLRDAHRALLGGKAVDVQRAEADHKDHLRRAIQEVRRLIVDADESPSEQTMIAINETLEALPSGDESPGRLTRPLKRMGFEALAGVPSRPPGARPPKLKLVKSGAGKSAPEVPAATRREIDEIETRLGQAATEERQARADLERARRELERAERDRTRAEEELTEATAKAKRFQEQLAAREKALRALTAEQEKLEKRLEKLR